MSVEEDRLTVFFESEGYRTLSLKAVEEHHLLEPALEQSLNCRSMSHRHLSPDPGRHGGHDVQQVPTVEGECLAAVVDGWSGPVGGPDEPAVSGVSY